MAVITHPNTVVFWFPADADEASATMKVELKAPEFGDSYTEGRNVTVTQPRSGAVVVYDHGTPFSKQIKLQFRDVPDVERAALIVLFDAVGWTAGVIRFKDYNGYLRNVRVMTNRLETKAMSPFDKYALNPIFTFDFDVDLLDVSSNILSPQDSVLMPSALTLHLADIDSPHAPETTVIANVADGLKLLDSFPVDDYAGCIWIGVVTNGPSRHMFQVQADHNGTTLADATSSTFAVTVSGDIGLTTAIIAYDVSLSGSGTSQVLRLRASTTVDGYTFKFRRIRIGKTVNA